MAYTNPNFINNSTPAINATNLNNLANAVQNLTVPNGGTGKNSITSGALVKGNGTGAVGEVSGTGALYSQTSGNPQFGTLPVNCGGTGTVTLDALKENMGLTNAGFVISDTAPSITTVLWIDSDNSTLKYYNGTNWIPIRGVYGSVS